MTTRSTVLVSGSAGFIGAALSHALLDQGHSVVGFDNLSASPSSELKSARNERLLARDRFSFHKGDLADHAFLSRLPRENSFETIYHLAGQVGVRESWEVPDVYFQANVEGTKNLLDAFRGAERPPAFMMASSSSVYGAPKRFPSKEDDSTDHAISPYGVSKRAAEMIARTYAQSFGLRITALRFFTVYGPWGRPDMAPYKFVQHILEGREIEIYNGGEMARDFTYVDDIVAGILALAEARAKPGLSEYDDFNIGAARPVQLLEFISVIENLLQRKARLKKMPAQPGDAQKTHADTSKLEALTGFRPKIEVPEGMRRFIEWYGQWRSA